MSRVRVVALAAVLGSAACGHPASAVAPPSRPAPTDAAVATSAPPPAANVVLFTAAAPSDPPVVIVERCSEEVEVKLRVIQVAVRADALELSATVVPDSPVTTEWSFRFGDPDGDDPAAHLTLLAQSARVLTFRLTGVTRDQLRVAGGIIASPPQCAAPASRLARIIKAEPESSGGTRITVAIGSEQGIGLSWTAALLLDDADALRPGGAITIVTINRRVLVGIVRLPPAVVARSSRVRLTRPLPDRMTP